MRFARRRTLNGAVLATFAISAVCRAATLHVPADYPTIQACNDAADNPVATADECDVAQTAYVTTMVRPTPIGDCSVDMLRVA
jgi:hypothetical protein